MRFPSPANLRRPLRPRRRLLPVCGALLLLAGCRPNPPVIAVIPRTSGNSLWDPVHAGAQSAALQVGLHLYWNAPTREDDIAGQIALVEKAVDRNYQGLVLAPDHALALITPVRRAMRRGLPTVIVGSPLAIPPGNGLSYILNDEEEGGRIAAQRLAAILHGEGTVALLGIDPDILGIMTRARSLNQYLAAQFPRIHIVAMRLGSFNVPREQQIAEETLKANPGLDAIVALTATSTHGAISAIADEPSRRARVIAFDPDFPSFDAKSLDSLVVQNTGEMGAEAIRNISGAFQGRPVPPITELEPILVTRENWNSPEIRALMSVDWRPGPLRWRWKVAP